VKERFSLGVYLRRKFQMRRVLVLTTHVVLYAIAFLGAFLLRFDFTLPGIYSREIIVGLILIVGLRTIAGFTFRLYGGVLKYAGIHDLIDIVKAMTLASLAFVVVLVLVGLREFPRSIIALDWLGSIMLIGGLRFGLRTMRELLATNPEEGGIRRKRVAIIGAGDAGENLVRDLQRTYRDRYEVVGFFDDNAAKRGLRIHDVPVLASIMYIGDLVLRRHIDEVIIAIPSASGETMRRIVSICKIAGVRFRTIPGVDQLIDGTVTVNQIRDVAIEDLLGREPVDLEEGLVRKFLFNKIVMVTGAGGSIGSELCRQIVRYHPRKLILLERSEPGLFFIHRELRDRYPDQECIPVIADISDSARVERLFIDHGPEVIFHAAAHKHVPMMEWNPGEAVKNNVFGTKAVADLAHQYNAQAFVFISTDKAVNPSSVMGTSKRIAEMYVQALARSSQTTFTAVRFGNVLGSVGSVVPIFKEQIAKGGPVTVTHPDMRRYFMTIPESCQLVMQSAAMGEGGEIFVLDMGEPIRIVDLARDLITLSGFEPDKDIRIVYTGLRPGEKLFEELSFDGEKMEKTHHPKIFIGKLAPVQLEYIYQCLQKLDAVMNESVGDAIRRVLKEIVPEFQQVIESDPGVPLPRDAASQNRGDIPDSKRLASANVLHDSTRGQMARESLHLVATQAPPAPITRGASIESITTAAPEIAAPKATSESVAPDAAPDPLTPEGNAAFDEVWKRFVALSATRGFNGVAWKTYGVKPSDKRRVDFGSAEDESVLGNNGIQKNVLKRSVAISSLAFVELKFFYSSKPGKKIPDPVRNAVREICSKMSVEIVSLHRSIGV
jgi:FlaA1/EpsC-like NDP-sugar epimerase